MTKTAFCGAFVAAVAIACGSADPGGSPSAADVPPGSNDSFVTTKADGGSATTPTAKACTTDAECGSGGTCNPATKTCACGGASVPAEVVAPNFLLVLDRSCSMTDVVGGKTKWTIAVDAIQKLLTANTGKIRFGLELFPDTAGNSCAQDGKGIAVQPGNEAKIASLLGASLSKNDANFPDGPCVTNIDTGIQAAQSEPSFSDKTRKSFVVLITDGQQSSGCTAAGGDKGTTKIITDLHAAGVDTFVVGFGSGVDAAQMNAWATAGGRPRAGATKFYDAADSATLDAAFAAIAKKTLGCTMKLASPPPGNDPSLLYVFFDAAPTPVARDATHASGWDYDSGSQTVTFYGDRCDALQAGTVQKASVVFGCQGGPPPANPVQ